MNSKKAAELFKDRKSLTNYSKFTLNGSQFRSVIPSFYEKFKYFVLVDLEKLSEIYKTINIKSDLFVSLNALQKETGIVDIFKDEEVDEVKLLDACVKYFKERTLEADLNAFNPLFLN